MISRFFIDRPIFATVISIVITLTGGIALLFLPIAQYPRITPPGVSITISYPGASAQEVADTIGAPIEQQVNGVDNVLYMSSQSGNDGSYTLTVTFDIGTDLKTALVKVQNRVTLAMPQLPTPAQNQGITIRKRTPDMLMIVNFIDTSKDKRHDDKFLSNFATINCKDELLRVPGVSDMTIQGQRDYSMRIWLDPQKLASRNMTAIDVANAVRSENADAPAGRIGQPPVPRGQTFQYPLNTLGRLTEIEDFENIIVKVGGLAHADVAGRQGDRTSGVFAKTRQIEHYRSVHQFSQRSHGNQFAGRPGQQRHHDRPAHTDQYLHLGRRRTPGAALHPQAASDVRGHLGRYLHHSDSRLGESSQFNIFREQSSPGQ